jgi:hypothetical protein
MEIKEEIKLIKTTLKNNRISINNRINSEFSIFKRRLRILKPGFKYVTEGQLNKLKSKFLDLCRLKGTVISHQNQINKLGARITRVRREKSVITHCEAKEILGRLSCIRANTKYVTEKDFKYLNKRIDTAAGLYKSINTLRSENVILKVDIETLRSEIKMFGRIIEKMKVKMLR